MYTLHTEIEVAASIEDVWRFISHPQNLDRITPDDMSFKIVSPVPEVMFNGLLVEYRVRIPLMGWQPWVSEIKHIDPGRYFVDEQKIGPYRFWYHEHLIEQAGEKVRMVDHVSYEVPFGLLGRPVHAGFIRPTLKRIFDHREQCFQALLPAGQ
ncbi:MAG: SRPBCC family protein [Pontiellaceae bacterium]|nr:SRPBCC family protein [Pontiellaceae bacterium]MBN2786595.1 SRPBCC family protein [Pontiellaceae bacterium]